MMTFMLIGFMHFLGDILLAWATLQQLYISKSLSLPPPQIKMIRYTQLFLNLNQNAINKIILQNNIIFGFSTHFCKVFNQ